MRAVSGRMKLTAKAITMDQKTARMGVNPTTMIATMAMREVKWNPYRRVSCQRDKVRSKAMTLAPNFLASNSTMRKMAQ